MIRLFLTLVILLSLSAPASAQELWRSTRAGMSVADVLRIFPTAAPPETPSSAASETEVLLTLPMYYVHGEPYRAAFVFRDKKLEKVSLSHVEKRNFENLMPVYQSVLTRLRRELGQETSHRTERSEIIKNEEHTWFTDHRAVQINLVSFLDANAVFAIRYQARTAKGVFKF